MPSRVFISHFVSFPKITEYVSQICAIFGSRWLCARLFTATKRNEGFEGSVFNRHTQLLLVMKVVSAQILKLDVNNVITKKRCQVSGKFFIVGEILGKYPID